MVDGMMRYLFTTLSPTLSRLRERGLWLPLPQAGEGWGEGIFSTLLALFVALFSVAVSAEDLPDPTRPPAFIAGAGAVTGRWATGSRSSGLQSTIISESRRAAIIDGKTVELGEKHGNARLTEVNEGSVVLRTAQTRRVLTLFPDVKMTRTKIPDQNKTKAE